MDFELSDEPSVIYQSQFDFTDSDVSITFTQNLTTVLCSISGPTELPSSKRMYDRMLVNTVYTRENGSSEDIREINEYVETMIESSRFPRSGVVINLHQLTDNGSRIATSINGATLALLDSAIPLNVLLFAVAVSFEKNGRIIINPRKDEEESARATGVVIYKNVDNTVEPVGFKSYGPIEAKDYRRAVEATKTAASELLEYIRRTMSERLKQKNAS